MATIKKKTTGFGTIRQRNDGRWEGRFTDPITKKQKSAYGKTQKEVKQKLTEIYRKIDINQYVATCTTTFDEVCVIYLETVKKYRVKPQTYSGYVLRYKNIFKDFIGDKPIQKITEEDIYRVIRHHADNGKSKSYIKSACVTVKEVFNFAVRKKMVAENPMQYVNPNLGKSKTIKRELSEDELKWFFKGIDERYGRHSIMFRLLLYTGMRVSEVCALRWEDIDSDYQFLYVYNNISRYQDPETGKYIQYFCTPKTESSRRCVPLKKELQELFDNYKKECELNMSLMNKRLSPHNLVFMHDMQKDEEEPFNDRIVNNIINTTRIYIKNTYGYEINHFTAHFFRHKFISVAMRNKMPLRDLMNMVGHTEVNTIMNYAHTSSEYILENLNNLPAMF